MDDVGVEGKRYKTSLVHVDFPKKTEGKHEECSGENRFPHAAPPRRTFEAVPFGRDRLATDKLRWRQTRFDQLFLLKPGLAVE